MPACRMRQKGPARNDVPYLVLLDLAAIFEWLTGRKSARAWFKSGLEEEQPPFHAFAAAVWPVLFCSDDGLSNAMRSWNLAEGSMATARRLSKISHYAIRTGGYSLKGRPISPM
jgi:hypothetical protein